MLTVKEFKELVSGDNIKLIAGENGLDNTIDYLNVQEIAQRSSWVRKNGLIMTTFNAFQDLDSILLQLEWYADLKTSAIGVHSAIHSTIPKDISDKANELALPLFKIPSNLPYYFIFEKVNKYLHNQAETLRQQVNKVNDSMLNTVLVEQESSQIIRMMGDFLKTTVIYLNHLKDVKSIWNNEKYLNKDIITVIEDIKINEPELFERVKIGRQIEVTKNYSVQTSDLQFTIYPLRNEIHFFGYLIVAIPEEKNINDDIVIKHGITALLLDGMKKNATRQFLKNQDVTLFEDIIHGRRNTVNEENFSFPVSLIRQLMIVETTLMKIRDQYLILESILQGDKQNSFLWISDNFIVVILTERLYPQVIENIKINLEDVNIALSSQVTPFSARNFKKIYNQALLALKHSKLNKSAISCWDELRVERVISFLSEHYLFEDYTNKLLGPLIESDKNEETDFMNTLYIYLDSFFSLKDSAKKLYVHPNTVKYRLQKIQELLPDMELNDTNSYLDMMVALKMYKAK